MCCCCLTLPPRTQLELLRERFLTRRCSKDRGACHGRSRGLSAASATSTLDPLCPQHEAQHEAQSVWLLLQSMTAVPAYRVPLFACCARRTTRRWRRSPRSLPLLLLHRRRLSSRTLRRRGAATLPRGRSNSPLNLPSPPPPLRISQRPQRTLRKRPRALRLSGLTPRSCRRRRRPRRKPPGCSA